MTKNAKSTVTSTGNVVYRADSGVTKASRAKVKPDGFQCPYCKKSYVREKTLLTHPCLIRDRWNSRDTLVFKLALKVWMEFMTTFNLKYPKEYEPDMAFCRNANASGFLKYAEYLMASVSPDLHDRLSTFLVSSGIDLYDWTKPETLQKYIMSFNINEDPLEAVMRSIPALHAWAITTGNDWTKFFELCSTQRLLLSIESGVISPYIIYASNTITMERIMTRMTQKEQQYFLQYASPTKWKPMVSLHRQAMRNISSLLKEYGL